MNSIKKNNFFNVTQNICVQLIGHTFLLLFIFNIKKNVKEFTEIIFKPILIVIIYNEDMYFMNEAFCTLVFFRNKYRIKV